MIKILLSLLIATSTLANVNFCNDELGKLPILQDGRIKPLTVHAKEVIHHLTGKYKAKGYSSVDTFCLLSSKAFGLEAPFKLETKIEHKNAKKLLGGKSSMALDDLIDENVTIRMAYQKEKVESGYKKELNRLLNKIALYQDITSGNNWQLPVKMGNEISWEPVTNFLTKEKVDALAQVSSTPFKDVFAKAKKDYIEVKGEKYLTEFLFDKLQLTKIAFALTLIGLAALVLFKKFGVALALSTLTIIVQTVYIALRVYISGRAPITNMYETVIFSGYGALLLSMIIGHLKNEKTYLYMGLAYNLCTLMMITFATNMVSPSISPLVPVLRDNFWLSTHVTTIIMSYGALALSWILANTILFKRAFTDFKVEDETYYNDLIYTTLKYGIIMLAAGIILGGVWADYSWGRFWGWDPKETWSLIVLCIYMAILHGKYTNWITNKSFSVLVAAAFMSVMMAWFGVNYILATGLHSYGFSQGGAYFLGTFFAVQTIFLILTVIKSNHKAA
ncbi:cytochrome c biogenesis protein [Halobacteriovorax sp. RT-1-4]|uniref:cytochrome c biogenesis protein n=1 Tax=unclassified Halobacteriovorax TaxID=2639665 RepID=UPI003999F9F2